MKRTITTASPEETEILGQKIGQVLRGGEVVELVSDLGGGKTTFARGFVFGAGSKDHVSSPTFTISNIYEADKITINHFDFYRLPSAGLMEYELEDIVGEPDQVVIIEWSDVVVHVLPKNRLTVSFASGADDGREITLEYPKELAHLLELL